MEPFYQFIQNLGYDHPLHPPVTHLPTGLVVGAVIFLLVSLAGKRRHFLNTAHHCMVLALLSLFPVAFLGITDWMHFYSGAWLFPVKIKIVLTGALLISLAAAVITEMRKTGGIMSKLFVYFLCFFSVVGLGYFGGSLVFSEHRPALAEEFGTGEKIYFTHCAGCHPKGGNVINPSLPVVGSIHLKDLNAFTEFNRNPLRPDGSRGVMPPFPEDKITDRQMRQLYEYVTRGLAGGQSP